MSKRIEISDIIRALGILLIAAKGHGKSRLIGRDLVFSDFLRGIATILLDPIGESINNFLSRLTELPEKIQRPLWERLIYIDLAGRGGYVSPFPLYYRLNTESVYQIAQRPLDVIRKADSFLLQAPVHGWNPTWLIGTHAGRILAAARMQISELEHLLTYPEQWEARFQEIEKTTPEAAQSVAFFRSEYIKWSKDRRISRTEALRIKAATFTLDPETLAMFSASTPKLNIGQVIDKHQIVLIDISGVTDIERRRFMLMWLVSYIMAYIKDRGPGHNRPPLSFVIDEFSLLTHFQTSPDDSFSQELDEMINVYSRSHKLWLTIASQSLGQFTEGTQRSLLSLGTQIFGAIPDMESAAKIAHWVDSLDPKAVKQSVPIYFATNDMEHGMPTGPRHMFYPKTAQIIDYRDEFYTLTESEYLAAKKLRDLPQFNYLIRLAHTQSLLPMQIKPRGRWVDEPLVERAKTLLRKRDGLPVGPLLAQIASRIPKALPDAPRTIKPTHEKQRGYLPDVDEE